MGRMKEEAMVCRDVMEEMLEWNLDEDVLGRDLYVAIKNVRYYRQLVTEVLNPKSKSWFCQEVVWREQRAIDTIFALRYGVC